MNTIPGSSSPTCPLRIEELPRLSGILGVPACSSNVMTRPGSPWAVTRLRKLEFLVAEAQEQGARTLLSCGAIQSNHCAKTAAAAAALWL